MLERDIEKKVCEYAKKKDMLAIKFSSPTQRGVCDRIFICNGYVFFVEFKQEGKKPTPLQHRHHQLLASKNIHVYVVDNIELGKEVVDHEYKYKGNKPHGSAVRNFDGNRD